MNEIDPKWVTEAKVYMARIREGVLVCHDHRIFKWPKCAPPKAEWDVLGEEYRFETRFPDAEFWAEWTGFLWRCRRPGYGMRSWLKEPGGYGNGSVLVRPKEAVQVLCEAPPLLADVGIKITDE